MSIISSIAADVQRQSRADRELTTQIAEYLAVEARDDMSRLYVNQAEEILAMVREADRGPALQAVE